MTDTTKAQTVKFPDTSGLIQLAYPGPSLRPVPRFTIGIPPTWVVSEFPDALFAMGTPALSPEPWSNAIVHHRRVLPNTALEVVALNSWAEFHAQNPDAVVNDERLVRFELFHYIREVQLTMTGVDEPVTRLDSYVFGPDVQHSTVDLFHIVWLNPTRAGDERLALHLSILSTLHFE